MIKRNRKKVKKLKTNIGKECLRSKRYQHAGKKVKKRENVRKETGLGEVMRDPLRAGSIETQVLKKNT